MDVDAIIEQSLHKALAEITVAPCPSRLAQALDYAIFPGGARVRPKLVLAVASACSDQVADLSLAACAAIEFLHCASLVQDDLKCFDDASLRRAKASVHIAFDERLAILASDALIVSSFDIVARASSSDQNGKLKLVSLLAQRVGSINGITAGQAWECEAQIDTEAYHQAKTGSLFAAATEAGAISVGAYDQAWRHTGECIGAAYQIADDLHDTLSTEKKIGKPVNVDAKHGRPNALHELGVDAAVAKLKGLIEEVVDTVPDCEFADRFIQTVHKEANRFFPKEIARSAA